MKKFLAVLLSLIMILSAVTCVDLSAFAVQNEGDKTSFSSAPDADGESISKSSGDSDTYAYLYSNGDNLTSFSATYTGPALYDKIEGGYFFNKYDENWHVIDTWYCYSLGSASFSYDLVYGGTSYTGLTSSEVYDITGTYPSVSDGQSYENQWGVGKHYVTVTLYSKTCSVEVEVKEDPYVSLEVLETQPSYPLNLSVKFKYVVTDKDGNRYYGYSDYYGIDDYKYGGGNSSKFNPHVEKIGEWHSGPGNLFTVSIGNLTATGEVDCLESTDWDYTEINGGAYITDSSMKDEELIIPVSIDGIPVIGISGLNMGDSWVVPDTTVITVPDSDNEISLSQRWLGSGNCEGYQVINLGKSVKNIDNGMFTGCERLREINVSADNPYYTSVNGVVYTKDMKTLVAFPRGFEGAYNVPAEVENIDIITLDYYKDIEKVFPNTASSKFVKENGVTYNKDKTVVLFADKNISGNYAMPSSVKEIREKAFDSCTKLTGVTISNNVTELVYAVFADCSSLKNVTIPDSVKTIGDTSFGGCTAMTDITVPSSVETIDYRAFTKCAGLTVVKLNNGLGEIKSGAFSECLSLGAVVIPDTVKTIGGRAFYNDTALSSVKIGRGIEGIYYLAFGGCASLATVTLPDKVIDIDRSAFDDTAIYNNPANRQNGLFYIGKHLIKADDDEIGDSVTVRSGTKYITDDAFYYFQYAKSLSLPASLEYFNPDMAWDYNNLETILVENGGETYFSKDNIIYEKQTGKAIYYARRSAATSVAAPDSVTEFVYYCRPNSNVKSITLPNKLVSLNKNFNETKWYTSKPEGPVYLGNMLYAYKGHPYDVFSVNVKNGTLGIGAFAFEGQVNLSSVTLPNSLEEIGNGAFLYCFSLTSVNIPSSVKRIKDHVFANCKNLQTVTLNNGLEEIGYFAFAGCPNLTSLTIPASVKEIGIGAFSGCTSLESITVDPSNENFKIVDGALYSADGSRFIWCPSSKTGSLTLDSAVLSVDPYAFSDTSVTDIYIDNAQLEIQNHAFNTFFDVRYSDCDYYTERTLKEHAVILHSLTDSTAKKYEESNARFMFEVLEDVDTEKLELLSELGGNVLALRKTDASKLSETSKAALEQAIAQAQAALNNKDITIEEINREIERVTEIMNSLEEVLPDKEFPDVPKGAWFYDAATYCANKGFINGYGNGRFGATDPLQRQDFVVILANIANADLSGYTTCKLKDVDMKAYYGKAVAWAVDKGIIAGYQNGKFGVGDPINREQVATILYRYMKNPAVSDVDGKLAKFPDKGNISEFAKAPLAWAVENNIISGMQDGTVAPKGTAVRAQIASIIMRMDQNGMFNA